MIPNSSTPIKNEILIDIFAKGLLSKDEMRIVCYIIRWSWGFKNNEDKSRRQDWTKKLTRRQIANDIEMDESWLNKLIKKMIKENKIIYQDGAYQFNEHYENWWKLPVKNEKKLVETTSKTGRNYQSNWWKLPVKLVETTSQTDLKPNNDNSLTGSFYQFYW